MSHQPQLTSLQTYRAAHRSNFCLEKGRFVHGRLVYQGSRIPMAEVSRSYIFDESCKHKIPRVVAPVAKISNSAAAFGGES